MAALVQSIPQQSSTVPVLQSHPSSSSSSSSSSQPQPSAATPRNPAMSWNNTTTTMNSAPSAGPYRGGHQVVAPYAFTTTPNLANSAPSSQNRRSWSPHLSSDHRTSSAPSAPQILPPVSTISNNNPSTSAASSSTASSSRMASLPAAGSVSTTSSSSNSSSSHSHASKDDSAIPSAHLMRNDPALRPLSTSLNPAASLSSSHVSSTTPPSKSSPDRYRRGNRRADVVVGGAPSPNASAPLSVPSVTVDDHSLPAASSATSPGPQSSSQKPSAPGHARGHSVDNSQGTEKQVPELAKRYRRKSLGTVDSTNDPPPQVKMSDASSLGNSARDGNARTDTSRSSNVEIHESRPISDASPGNNKAENPTQVNNKPSSSSQPLQSTTPKNSEAPESGKKADKKKSDGPALQRLSAIGGMEPKKQGRSRLRRAFSFGSASDVLKASAEHEAFVREMAAAEPSRREQLQEELGAEQAAIAEQQEASGLGESIYSHQGPFFRSTDDLSVSSTASSASVMLRKMSKGVKKGSRSLVGLFRPKSLVNGPSSDAPVGPTEPALSMVNVEVDKKSPKTKQTQPEIPRRGASLPKLETHCLDSSRAGPAREDAGGNKSNLRKSVVGGDRERAEVLAAMGNSRKGILKKSYSDSGPSFHRAEPSEGSHSRNGSDSPHSSVPSTPVDQSSSRRTDSVKIAGEDYFTAGARLHGDAPGTSASPPPGVKNIVFSPRIQFYDTWTSGEYDRRADIATCNRLTPLLAQQIKEELNNFKLEMDVHEMSKVYTHFI